MFVPELSVRQILRHQKHWPNVNACKVVKIVVVVSALLTRNGFERKSQLIVNSLFINYNQLNCQIKRVN